MMKKKIAETIQLMKWDDSLMIAIPKTFTSQDTELFLERLDGYLNKVLYDDEFGLLFSELTVAAGELTLRIIIPYLYEDFETDILVFRWDVLSFELKDYYCLELMINKSESDKVILELREKVLLALEDFFSEKI